MQKWNSRKQREVHTGIARNERCGHACRYLQHRLRAAAQEWPKRTTAKPSARRARAKDNHRPRPPSEQAARRTREHGKCLLGRPQVAQEEHAPKSNNDRAKSQTWIGQRTKSPKTLRAPESQCTIDHGRNKKSARPAAGEKQVACDKRTRHDAATRAYWSYRAR